ncbi:hypothetical protein IAU60_001358 [Kwoniella sp. DSM 27419]
MAVAASLLCAGMEWQGVEGRVLPPLTPRAAVGAQGSPLLVGPGLGPPSVTAVPSSATATEDDDGDGISDSIASTASTSKSFATTSSTASLAASSAGASPNGSTSSTTASATSTPSDSSVTTQTTGSPSAASSVPTGDGFNAQPPVQISSVRYLVPVFLLIVITLAGFAYQAYRKRQKRGRRRSAAGKEFEKVMRSDGDPFAESGSATRAEKGWKEVRGDESDDGGYGNGYRDDEDGLWDARMDEVPQITWEEGLRESQGRCTMNAGRDDAGTCSDLARSGGLVSAGARGWGWRDSWKQFKCARGRQAGGVAIDEEIVGEKTTMRLVTRPDRGVQGDYQTIPDIAQHTYAEVPIAIRRSSPHEHQARSQPKQGGGEGGSIRALRDKIASLTYGVTSAPSGRGRPGLDRSRSPNKRANGVSGQAQTHDPPSPPAWIRPRAVSPTSVLSPPLHPHLFFHPAPAPGHGPGGPACGHSQMITDTDDRSVSEYDHGSDVDTATIHTVASRTSSPGQLGVSFPRIPSTASGLAGAEGYSMLASNGVSSPLASPTAMRRSTAIQDLSLSTPPPLRKKDSLLSPKTARTATTTEASPAGKQKKSRAQRKQDRARDKVEDILKASWSDRALTSPTLGGAVSPPMSSQLLGGQTVPGLMSPGLEETGGIEQRLALLQRVQL